ncbi:ubiquitin carboxyl-terminal hydrolase MINDY-1-like [Heracleum sosnowskyi]|uniref:Ubiquitin carboxyl-terminal hydrolase MINDY-1-like n=1 Tax=Heracleum sosnowskyi TaxID=360622 RepID=A0AAD8HWT3_9APIA|nr:ubiquitin carboxyl-terminal hydrolase MINDY-1-like [Heracleum sosnowskyi]
MASSGEERTSEELTHKTKLIQFFGRSTPIILQNDNGPCPLLAICNVLLLKNNLNLSPDIPEISQERLLSLVAERLIDSNSNVDNKDVGYVENQQQNIADAIDLLPRLTTGIDVNIKFKGITEFEFTRECAIFDLLDIPLYHGWIVDPQDSDTCNAIGSKSYNTIMGDLVGLETGTVGSEDKKRPEEDSVDFVAATTATLGVPSPSLSRGLSFDDSTGSVSDHNKARKGDLEEEAELLRAMKLSEVDLPNSSKDVSLDSTDARNGDLEEEAELLRAMKMSEANFPKSSKYVCSDRSDEQNVSTISNESVDLKTSEPLVRSDTKEGIGGAEIQNSGQQEPSLSNESNDLITFETIAEKHDCLSSENDKKISNSQLSCEEPGECNAITDVSEKTSSDFLNLQEAAVSDPLEPDLLSTAASSTVESEGTKQVQDQFVSKPNVQEEDNQSAPEALYIPCSTVDAKLDASGKSTQSRDVYETVNPSGVSTEPIYAGEECILEPGTTSCEDQEPVYEGEVVIAEQVDKNSKNASDVACKNEITLQQGELIKDFLKTNASQLTVYGLIRLQEELKERELCVFFRNNHFNTMFKFGGQLYLLATDQGYINQPDLVWEMLNEVNGNTVFVTGTFKEFRAEDDHVNTTWDEQNARASTAEYLASINDSAQDDSSFDSDLQLARALQEQEFEQQPRRNTQQPNVSGGSGLVTGPQTSRSSNNRYLPQPSKPVSKPSKDKCVVM